MDLHKKKNFKKTTKKPQKTVEYMPRIRFSYLAAAHFHRWRVASGGGQHFSTGSGWRVAGDG